MILWRISNYASLDGVGGLRAAARWHSQGRRIVYLATSPASAPLEALVHLELKADAVPERYQLLEIEVPDSVSRSSTANLPAGWASSLRVTREIGDTWLAQGASALLAVPSVIVPHTESWLLNPAHADARSVFIVRAERFSYDSRLFPVPFRVI